MRFSDVEIFLENFFRRGCNSMVEYEFSKLGTRVRFPSPAQKYSCAPIAQRIEHLPSKETMAVRFRLGAPERKSQRVLVRLVSLGD